jgi:hypothetical protein
VACAGLAVPSAASAAGTAFSVSTSAEPARAGADGVVHTQVTVANNGAQDLSVALRSVGVRPHDDGKADLTDESDPVWGKAITMPSSVRLAARTYRSIPITIRVPAGLLPDLYLLGFIAEAQPTDPHAPVRIYDRIGALVTVEIPGARERKLRIDVTQTGFIQIGSSFDSGFDVRNIGEAGALARNQVLVSSSLTHDALGMVRTSDALELIPSGTGRHVSFSYPVHGLFLYARPQVQVIYGNGTPAMQEITVQGRAILVIPWLTLVLLGFLATLLTAYLVWLRRRRAARRELIAERRRARVGRHRAADAAWAR